MNKDRFIRINKIAAAYFREKFQKNKQIQEYVYKRIDKSAAERFHLGYSPNKGLLKRLSKFEVTPQEAYTVGLVNRNQDGTYYEVFSKRIIFPIVHAGVLVAFGGRVLYKGSSKYINSKSSKLYDKSEILYGLWYTRKEIGESGYALLVEGYFDVLSLYSENIKNCVATCGTELTIKHINMLKRYTNRCKILFDGDEAGKKASAKAKSLCLQEGMATEIIKLPDSLDPDDYLKKKGRKKLLSLLGNT